MCDCIKRIEQMLTDEMVKQNSNAEIIKEVEFVHKHYILENGRIAISTPVLGWYMIGKQKRKFDTSMFFTYCSYCGEKYTQVK